MCGISSALSDVSDLASRPISWLADCMQRWMTCKRSKYRMEGVIITGRGSHGSSNSIVQCELNASLHGYCALNFEKALLPKPGYVTGNGLKTPVDLEWRDGFILTPIHLRAFLYPSKSPEFFKLEKSSGSRNLATLTSSLNPFLRLVFSTKSLAVP